jgi:hypothetical protein
MYGLWKSKDKLSATALMTYLIRKIHYAVYSLLQENRGNEQVATDLVVLFAQIYWWQ